ncbi:hypothetical protein HID58_062847 [Brassica napus]|uniref:Uncharacterized protein n=1 Tax=Brassica napus TaxID=3708 RepID=A0ABQ8A2N7_BRANA|nr:hypothetical protein HID58_062847 [Brassica napus]
MRDMFTVTSLVSISLRTRLVVMMNRPLRFSVSQTIQAPRFPEEKSSCLFIRLHSGVPVAF